jgi:fused signal recognition particle receptor
MTTAALVVALVIVIAAVTLFLARARTRALQPPATQAPRAIPAPPAPAAPKPKHLAPPPAPAQPPAPPPPIEVSVDQPQPWPRPGLAQAPTPSELSSARAVPAPATKDVAGLRRGLAATRGGFIAKLAALFRGKNEIDSALLAQVEEVMLASDVGPKTTSAILERLRQSLERENRGETNAIWTALRSEASRILAIGGGPIRTAAKPTVVLMVGVNGAGKTTTIGKLATRYIGGGTSVMLAAGDTFRAAAVQQLEVWGKRVGATVIKGKEGADPGAVAFDAATAACQTGVDLLLVDTAGRLHTKVPLMDEIRKVRKTLAKAMDGAPHETLLVLDATTGQNALSQAALFKEAVDLTGIVLTKLDGTAKGGVVLGICDELRIPIRYIGLGERAEDLREFVAEDFVEALFGRGDEEVAAA